jgi:hypothetical protein
VLASKSSPPDRNGVLVPILGDLRPECQKQAR